MPPPIEEDEALATGHENLGDDSDEMSEGLEPVSRASEQRRESYWQQEDEKPRREPSPMPVVSDIVANKIRTVADDAVPNRVSLPAPAPSLSATENPSEKRGKKRGRPYLKSFEDPLSKRRRGRKRDICCVYCVRRLAKDPHWACHDALVGQTGVGNYSGFRCSECVGAHTPCQLIPSGAKDAVQQLQSAAANYVASQGTDRVPLLAKYETAVDWALRAIASVPAAQDDYYKKGKKPLRTSAGKSPAASAPKAASKHWANPAASGRASSHSTPATDYAHHHNSNSDINSRSFSSAGQQYQQYQDGDATADPGTFHHARRQQQQQQQQHHPQDPAELERLERQALRRRKVEALESLAHTAALFLAEYMTANKTRQQAPAAGGPGGESGKREHDHGMDYAAAAAGMMAQMMAPLDQSERDGSANQQSRDESGTDSDGSDALTVSNGGRAGHHVEDGDGAVLLKKDARVSFAEEEDAAEDDDDDDRDVDMESAGAGSGFGDDEEDGPAAEEQGQLGGHDGDANDGDDGAGTDMERLPSEVKIEED